MKEKITINNRERQGVVTAIVGLALNLLMGVGKLVCGLITGAVSIVADGVNNLSDVGTSAVTVGSFALSSKKADREHPYGHGRTEYIASFIVSAIVLIVGAELAISSVERIVNGSNAVKFSLVALVVLIVSFSVKAFMACFYLIKNRKIKSDVFKASALDSVTDCVSTAFVAVAFALDGVTKVPFDSIAGIVAAVLIITGGIKLVLEVINKLLGKAADEETERQVFEAVTAHEEVLGVHDLMLHDYGAQRRIASIDAEFDENRSFSEVHAIVDKIEREVYGSLGINLVVHPDPVSSTDEEYLEFRHRAIEALARYGNEASFHELAVESENKQVSLHLRLGKKLMKYKEFVTAELIESMTAQKEGWSVIVQYDFL